MIRRLLSRFKLKALERQRAIVLEALRLPVPTQAIAAYRSKASLATINGLKAAVDEASRARFEERVQTVLKMRGSA
jgi:hypothetical protein